MATPSFEPRFARPSFGPGDLVQGTLEVVQPMDGLRTLNASLRYVDRSPSYWDSVSYAAAEPLHEGPAAVGDQIPFALQMPADAYPSWEEPLASRMGSLFWALVIEADIGGGFDTTTRLPVPVDASRPWTGPPPTFANRLNQTGKKWDVEIEPDRWSLRRGEVVGVDLRIGEPDASRETLKLGFICQAVYDVEEEYRGNSGSISYRRSTRRANLHEEWPEIDRAASTQTIGCHVPATAPFSYGGNAFGFVWMVVAREERKWRGDPRTVAVLEVLP
ncbi:MAG TPA: hypothetical protein VJT75_01730 [Thermoleophilaceae bacterium]|nr:hypothetical protein [Thermoleophilaceae bacterium]